MRKTAALVIGLTLGVAAFAQEDMPSERRIAETIELLDSAHHMRRLEAAKQLGKWGAHARAAEVPLLHALSDDLVAVRGSVAEALGRIGVASDAVRVGLLRRAEREPKILGVCIVALARLRAEPELLRLARDPENRPEMNVALSDAGADGAFAFLALCRAEEPAVRMFGVWGLSSAPPESRAQVEDELARRLDDSAEMVRVAAIRALALQGVDLAPVADRLLELLRTGSSIDQRAVLAALHVPGSLDTENSIARERRRAVELIAFESPHPEVRHAALRWTAAAGERSPAALAALARRLGDGHAETRGQAARALAMLTEASPVADPLVIADEIARHLDSLDGEMRVHAGLALAQLGSGYATEAAAAVMDAVQWFRWDTWADWPVQSARMSGGRSLRSGRRAGSAVPSVRFYSSEQVVAALTAIEGPGVNATTGLLESTDPSRRAHAAWILGTLLAPEASEHSRLLPLLKDADARVRSVSAAVLLDAPGHRVAALRRIATEALRLDPDYDRAPVDGWDPGMPSLLRSVGEDGQVAVASLLEEIDEAGFDRALTWLWAQRSLSPETRRALSRFADRDRVRALLDRDGGRD